MSNSLLVFIAVAAIALLVGCAKLFGTGGASTKERSERAHKMVAAGATLLDVRTPQEFAAGHIPGAINIPVSELQKRLAEVPKGSDVVTYCQSGRRSSQAEKILAKEGYTVFNLGGISDW